MSKYYRSYYERNRERIIKRVNENRKDRSEYFLKKGKEYRDRLKREVLEHYGNGEAKCALCNERDIILLCLDHINGNGVKHRKELGTRTSTEFYLMLNRLGFPLIPPLRVLCKKCNQRQKKHGPPRRYSKLTTR